MRGTGSNGPRTSTPVPRVSTLVQSHRKMAAHFSRRPGAFKRLDDIARVKNVRVLRFVTLAETRVASILTVVQTNLRNWEAMVDYFAEIRRSTKTGDADMLDLLQTALTEDVRRQSSEIEAVLYVLSQGAFVFQEEWRVTKSYAWYMAERARKQLKSGYLMVLDVHKLKEGPLQVDEFGMVPDGKYLRVKTNVEEAFSESGKALIKRALQVMDYYNSEPTEAEVVAMVFDPRTKACESLEGEGRVNAKKASNRYSGKTWKEEAVLRAKELYMKAGGTDAVQSENGTTSDSSSSEGDSGDDDSSEMEDDVAMVSITAQAPKKQGQTKENADSEWGNWINYTLTTRDMRRYMYCDKRLAKEKVWAWKRS